MPEVTDKMQADGAATAAPEATPKTQGKLTASLTKAAIFGAICALAILAAYMLTLKVLKPMLAHTPASATTEQVEAVEEPEPVAKSGHGGSEEEEHGGAEDAGKQSQFHSIESIVVNPAGSAGTRFLSCSVSFELESKGDARAYEALDVQIKDVLITILSSKTVDELANITDRNRMRREILSVVNKLTAPAKAKAVYLTDFVLQ